MDEITVEIEKENHLTVGSMNELQESDNYENNSECSDKTIDLDYQMDQTLSLFPFVCGLCYEKFNNVEAYYSHFGSSHVDTQRYFHSSCCDTDESLSQGSRLFYCGKCSYVSLSLCQLHEHLVDVENACAYQLVTDSRTAYPSAVKQEPLPFVDTEESETLEYGGSSSTNVTDREQYHYLGTNTRNIKSNKPLGKRKNDKHIVKDKTILKTTVDLERHTFKSLKTISESLSKKRKLKRPQTSKKVKSNIIDKKKSKIIIHDLKSQQKETIDEDKNEMNQSSDNEDKQDEIVHLESTDEMKLSNQGKYSEESKVCKAEDSNDVVSDPANVNKVLSLKEIRKAKKSKQPSEMYLPCEICGRAVKRRRLHYHMINFHNDERNFPCDECGVRFKCDVYLRLHKRTVHTLDDSVICQVCGKAFKNPGYLRQHVETHSERNKKCPQCPATFRTKYTLKMHMLRHSDEKPHKCAVCGKAFSVKANLRSHKVAHTDNRPHQCPTCGKSFKTRKDMCRHTLNHAPPKYECPVCSHMFVTPCNRKTHMKMHIRRGEYTEAELIALNLALKKATEEKALMDT